MSVDFRDTKDMRSWFDGMHGGNQPLAILWDNYFLCVITGLRHDRRVSLDGKNAPKTTTFIDGIPNKYDGLRRLLPGILIAMEVKRLGGDATSRNQVRQQIAKYIDVDRLSKAGADRLNEYALGGFELLNEKFPHRQADYSDFVAIFQRLLLVNV